MHYVDFPLIQPVVREWYECLPRFLFCFTPNLYIISVPLKLLGKFLITPTAT